MTVEIAATRIGRVAGAGLTLAYREWNAEAPGTPLVLLHGITRSSADWADVVRHLDGRRCIALDARGHGESDWDAGEAYGGDQHFADVATALESLRVERCVLVGFSMGGTVAILTAAALPDSVARLVVVDSYPYPRMTPGSQRIAQWVSLYGDRHVGFDPAISRHFRALLEIGSEERLDLTSMWEAVECPALVVRGEHSDVLPAAVAEDMVQRQPRASLVAIPGVAHPIPLARPKELASVIAEFANAVAPHG